jgi:hypothetical protein
MGNSLATMLKKNAAAALAKSRCIAEQEYQVLSEASCGSPCPGLDPKIGLVRRNLDTQIATSRVEATSVGSQDIGRGARFGATA